MPRPIVRLLRLRITVVLLLSAPWPAAVGLGLHTHHLVEGVVAAGVATAACGLAARGVARSSPGTAHRGADRRTATAMTRLSAIYDEDRRFALPSGDPGGGRPRMPEVRIVDGRLRPVSDASAVGAGTAPPTPAVPHQSGPDEQPGQTTVSGSAPVRPRPVVFEVPLPLPPDGDGAP